MSDVMITLTVQVIVHQAQAENIKALVRDVLDDEVTDDPTYGVSRIAVEQEGEPVEVR